jgi:lipopolysaccharide transport system permease protein
MRALTPDESRWTENRPSTGWFRRVDLGELWLYREVAYHLALRDLKLRYKQTAIGVAWVAVQPLVAVVIFSVVFGQLADVPSDGIEYPVFVYAGLIGWLYVSKSVEAAAESLLDSRELVTKVYFPRILAPLSAVLPGLVDLLPSLAILGVFMAVYGEAPDLALLTLPLWFAAAVLLSFGAGLWLSALNVLYRDVRYALGFLLQVWLFASPVVFPASLLDGLDRTLFSLNPVVGLLDGLRWALVDGPAPPAADLLSAVTGALLLLGGAAYFQRVERLMADRI